MVKNNLAKLRLKYGYKTQKEFAKFLEISRSQYCKYENNKEQPNIQILYNVSRKLNLLIDDLVYDETELISNFKKSSK